jgi:hypothetical protein
MISAGAPKYPKMIGQIEIFSPKSVSNAPQVKSKPKWSRYEFTRS